MYEIFKSIDVSPGLQAVIGVVATIGLTFVDDVADQFGTGSELRERILARFRAEGIEVPFPQRVVTVVGGEKLPSPERTSTAASTAKRPSRKRKVTPLKPKAEDIAGDIHDDGDDGSDAQG
jgi:hypothetical protein